MKISKLFLITLLVIFIDQAIKLWVHYSMTEGTHFSVFGDWLKIHYVLNPGMAFGMRLPAPYGKILLTGFRMIAIVGLAVFIIKLVKKKATFGVMVCLAMILGGAIGNQIDGVFYGVLLDNAPETASTPWFHGQVVDMIFFDIWEGLLPKWLPLIGGEYYAFWPIFNVADASIFIGVFTIILFYRKFFQNPMGGSDTPEALENTDTDNISLDTDTDTDTTSTDT